MNLYENGGSEMSLMNWNDKLDIGVDQMNDQHKIILQYMNTLYDDFQADKSFSTLKYTLDYLKDYTVKHFKEEEDYMESIQYEGIKSHKLIHEKLLKTFSEHYENIIATQSLNDDFFHFLKFWLSSHIQGIDVKYGKMRVEVPA